MASSIFSQGRSRLSFLLVLLLFFQPDRYGKMTHSQNTTTLQPNTTATTISTGSTGCSTVKEKVVIKQSGTEMPGCNHTDQISDVNQNCSLPSNCSIPLDRSPTLVKNLTIMGRTNSSITLIWESPPCPSSACGTNSADGWNCTAHFSDLNPGQNYTIVMYRVTEAGRCNQSAPVHETTLPNKPGNIIVTKDGTHNLTISWDPPKDPSAAAYLYRVFWVRENTTDHMKNGSTGTCHYTISGLLPGSVYIVKVVSVIKDAESGAVENWALTNPLPPPDFRVNTINQSAVHLSWGPPASPFSGFTLKLQKGPTETQKNYSFSSETSTLVLSALSPSTSYNFTLSSMAEGGGLKTFSTGICREGATMPEPVDNVQCLPVEGGYSLRVSWKCVSSGFSAFLVFVSGQQPRQWPSCDPVEVGHLQPARSYQVQVGTLWKELQTNSSLVRCETDSKGVRRSWRSRKQMWNHPVFLPRYLCRLSHVTAVKTSRTMLWVLPRNTSSCRTRGQDSPTLRQNFQKTEIRTVTATFYRMTALESSSSPAQVTPTQIISMLAISLFLPHPFQGYHGEKEYIATQGPLPETVCDFWRMIWEQRVTTLVMLTNCVENGRVKCERYWPLDYTPCTYGGITVSVDLETILPDWTIRDFTIKQKNECETRLARHYHYTSWPDHGVPPATSAILRFRDLVRKYIEQRAEGGLALVHCSAGVGRTGTFIALDTLLSQAQKEGRIGVYSFVQRMRMNRPLMIQTESQYVFLHQCLLDSIQPPPPDTSEKTPCTAVYENTLAFQDYEVSRV